MQKLIDFEKAFDRILMVPFIILFNGMLRLPRLIQRSWQPSDLKCFLVGHIAFHFLGLNPTWADPRVREFVSALAESCWFILGNLVSPSP